MKTTGLRNVSKHFFAATVTGLLGLLVASTEVAHANDIRYAETVIDTDYITAGVGGMRNSSTAVISLSGLSGTVDKAYLYWHGPMNVANPFANANIRLNGQNITGQNIGMSDDNCWGFLNSAAYKADVTEFVRTVRNGSYVLSSFVKQGTNINANGASLLVFFDDANPDNNRDIVLFEGNDSNAPNIYDALGWNIFLGGINYSSGRAIIQMHVSDGQTWEDDTVVLNGSLIQARGNGFQGTTVPTANNGPENNGSLWDIKAWDVTAFLAPGTNSFTLTHGYIARADGSPKGDCVSLVVAAINLPAGSAPPPPVNIPPTVTGIPAITNRSANPPVTLNVQALASDADGDALTYTISVDGTPVSNGSIPPGTPATSGSLAINHPFSLGQHAVVFTVNDGEASASFTTIVTILRDLPPVLNLPPNITVAAPPGQNSAVVTYTVTATDDFDPNPVIISLPPSGNSFPIGTTTVNATAVDNSGQSTQGSFTITVTDSTPPNLQCLTSIVRATDPGASNAVVHYTVSATDNHSEVTVSCNPPSGSTFPIGITAVNCQARDVAGNTASCSFNITITDTEPPVITTPTNMILVADLGQCEKLVNYNVTVVENTPGVSLVCLPASGTVFPMGATTVQCTAVDVAGNRATNSFTVTIQDNEKPTLNVPANITTGTDAGKNTAIVNYKATATDSCSVPTVVCRPASGTAFPLGVTQVTCQATDGSGNVQTGSFTVTVNDSEPPVITTSTNRIVGTDITQCSAVVTYSVTVRDNVPGATVTCTPPSGSVFPKGVSTVTCNALDAAGNTASASFVVTVVDNVKPVLSLPPGNVVVAIPATQNTAVVTFDISATDNCSVPTVVSTPTSGSTFPVGTNIVNVIATDADGNISTGSFNVIVVQTSVFDSQPPVINVPSNRVVGTDVGQCSAVVNYTVTVTDNQPGATVGCTPASGSAFPKGVTTVNCVAFDVSGNTARASFTVTVVDNIKPVLSVPANIVVVVPSTQSGAAVTYNVSATDNCSVPTVVGTPPSGSTFPVGTTTVNVTATDADGNISTGTFTVTVRQNDPGDQQPPVINVPTNRVVGTDVGQCSAVVNYTVTVTDNRPGATVSCTPASGSAFPKGVTTVNCVASDVAGNTANASFTVTVVDNQKPLLTLPGNMVIVIPSNQTSTVVTYNVSATDNCSVPTVVSTPPSGSTFPIGTNTVNVTATDEAGNVTTGSFTVIVRRDTGGDNQPPVIVSITPSKKVLWPPNHKMVPITLTVKATDASGKPVAARIISVTSNEPENGLGDGDTGPDWSITGNLKVNLRAERSGTGTGRTYTIMVEVKDAAGNITIGTVTVAVPHDMGKNK